MLFLHTTWVHCNVQKQIEIMVFINYGKSTRYGQMQSMTLMKKWRPTYEYEIYF